jgi:hypothetical protein
LTDTLVQLPWLPENPNWAAGLDRARQSEPTIAIKEIAALANCRIDFIQTARLDRALQQIP